MSAEIKIPSGASLICVDFGYLNEDKFKKSWNGLVWKGQPDHPLAIHGALPSLGHFQGSRHSFSGKSGPGSPHVPREGFGIYSK